MNSQATLNAFLQRNQRQNLIATYVPLPSVETRCRFEAKVGNAAFTGYPRVLADDARKSAAAIALGSLTQYENDETELRSRLGLEPRMHIVQSDTIRDLLKIVKTRTGDLTMQNKRRVLHAIVTMYISVNQIDNIFGIEGQNDI